MIDKTKARPMRFETLFADPRRYRGDCRLMRTAIRRGWLGAVPQGVRDALVARFECAIRERDEAGYVSEGQRARAILAQVSVAMDMVRMNQREPLRLLRYAWGGELTEQTTGRPRSRWHVTECPNRLDANDLRRRAKAEGIDLRTMRTIHVRTVDDPDDVGEGVAFAVVPDTRYGVRLWFACPRCRRRRVHLYSTRAGVQCRKCAGIAYGERERH